MYVCPTKLCHDQYVALQALMGLCHIFHDVLNLRDGNAIPLQLKGNFSA